MTHSTANGSITRFTRGSVCPVCGGSDNDPRGQGQRCHGFISGDRKTVFCAREEHAGQARYDPDSECYAHNAKGACLCGQEHAPVDFIPAKPNGRKVVDRVYKYRDAEGNVVHETVRYKDPKSFSQRRPVGNGKYEWNLKGIEPVLFNLPQLRAAAPDELVFIVEGEKDVERLGVLGQVATTNPMGAKKWRDHYSGELRGRRVAIIPDNDSDGREHAQQVARSLHGVAASVKIVEIPGLPEKGDVSDFLARGGTVDHLREMAEAEAEWKPPSNGKPIGAAPSANGVHQAEAGSLNLTEWGNAKRLIAAHGARLRYCKSMGVWLEWDGCRWCPDQTGAIWRWAKETVRKLGLEAANTADDRQRQATLRWALKSEEKKVMGAMIELAWSEPGISILPDQLDVDPWVLNTPSGTIDLKTGTLRPHRQSDLLSKITKAAYDAKAECPRWEKTVKEIFAGDDEMVAYVRRALGYSITGVIGEHALFLCHGTGRNGKNTILDTVQAILGDYATITNPRTFLAVGQNDHLAMLADLMGRRFVPTDEVEEGQQLAESMVKRVTGNKTLKARFMHKNPFEFPALFKIWMLANCKPEIQGQDEGIWSRIRLIPFEVFFPPEKRIKGLSDILVNEEGPGILRWLVEGSLEWQRIRLAEPKKVLDAIKDYRSEQNILMDFLGQCCKSYLDHPALRDQAREKSNSLYGRYVDWCKANGEKNILTNRKFGLKLTPLGYKPHEQNGTCYRLGLTLKDSGPQGCDEDERDRPAY